MQMHMDQWNMNNHHQFQRNQYGAVGGGNQYNQQQQPYMQYQPSSYTQQPSHTMMQYPHSANQSAQNINRANYMNKDERKGNLALTGELALGKNNNYQQISSGARFNNTANGNQFDNSNYEVDPFKSRGNTMNSYQMSNNQPPQQQQYMKIQQQQQQQYGVGPKNFSPNDIAQAQNSLRLLKQKMQNKETMNFSKQDLNSNAGDSSQGYQNPNSQSTTNTSLNNQQNNNKQYRKVFQVDSSDKNSNQALRNQNSDEIADNEFAPTVRQRGVQQRAQQQYEQQQQQQQNKQKQQQQQDPYQRNNQMEDNYGGVERNQINRNNNTNLNGSLKRDNSNNLQLQYQSSMQRTLEKKDPQMMYNAQRFNQMQNYEYTGNQKDDQEDFVFASNTNKRGPPAKKPPIQGKSHQSGPGYGGYQSNSSNTLSNKKEFSSPISGGYDMKQSQQQPPQAGSYRGEINGQKYYNFSKNLDSSPKKNDEDDDNEYESAANQKFMSKPKLQNNPSNQKFSSKTVGNEDDYYPQNNQPQPQAKSNRLAQLNKQNGGKQMNEVLEAPIVQKQQNINQPSKYDLSNIDQREANADIEGDLEECPEGCGRRFAPEALERHAKICKKVFQQKRKKFDMQKQRVEDEDHQQILQNAQMEEKRKNQYMNKNKQTAKSTKQPDKGSKWKQQSEQFRAAMKASKTGEAVESLPQYDDRKECPHCKRKFQEASFNKHQVICANIARNNKGRGFKK